MTWKLVPVRLNEAVIVIKSLPRSGLVRRVRSAKSHLVFILGKIDQLSDGFYFQKPITKKLVFVILLYVIKLA